MNKKFDSISFINTLIQFSPRQLKGETKTALFIISLLEKNKVPYFLQKFNVKVPVVKKAILKADKKKIECDGCCFIGGEISDKEYIISSSFPSKICQNDANLNFNPKCPTISNNNYYFAPAISVTHKGLFEILKAKNVKGRVDITPTNHKAINILVGNKKDPKFICFAHYDSIKKGAIDNASGTALLMDIVLSNPDKLKNTLYVFSASEELSYDKPIYWGYGFRVFEKKYYQLLKKAKKNIVIDSIGNGQTVVLNDLEIIRLGFPIKNVKKLAKKIVLLTGNFEQLMTVYHSDIDDGRGIKRKYLDEAYSILLEEMI